MVGIREVTRNTPGALGSDSGKGLRSDIVILLVPFKPNILYLWVLTSLHRVMGASGVGKSYVSHIRDEKRDALTECRT